MLSQICGEFVIASVTRCVCALYAVYTHTHTAVHSTTHTHTHAHLYCHQSTPLWHANSARKRDFPATNSSSQSRLRLRLQLRFRLGSASIPDSRLLLLLHLSLPRATHPKLCCPSCRCVSKQPQISLTLQRFRQTKKKRKQSNVERSRRITFPCGKTLPQSQSLLLCTPSPLCYPLSLHAKVVWRWGWRQKLFALFT